MANQSIACFEITVQLAKKAIVVVIHGGDTLLQTRQPQYTGGDDPSPELCRELFAKLSDAVENSKSTISLNVDADGETIIEDPEFVASNDDQNDTTEAPPPPAKRKKPGR